jgi:hypothetical protein
VEGLTVLQTLVNIAKARLMRKVLGRALGGPVGTALVVAYLGHKAYKVIVKRRDRLA